MYRATRNTAIPDSTHSTTGEPVAMAQREGLAIAQHVKEVDEGPARSTLCMVVSTGAAVETPGHSQYILFVCLFVYVCM